MKLPRPSQRVLLATIGVLMIVWWVTLPRESPDQPAVNGGASQPANVFRTLPKECAYWTREALEGPQVVDAQEVARCERAIAGAR